MRSIPATARLQFGVFTARQAALDGWSASALTRAVDTGALVHVRRGCYATPPRERSVIEARRFVLLRQAAAVAMMVSGATISHTTGLIAHALPVLLDSELPCITLAPRVRTQQCGLHLHRQVLSAEHLDDRYVLAVTNPARTCLDVARERGVAAGLVAADAAVRAGIADVASLRETYVGLRGTPGSRAARKVCDLVDGLSESPLESVSRLVLRQHAVIPEVQVPIRNRAGAFIARVDFYWADLGIVGEADGRSKYDTGAVLWAEKQREDRLTEAGLLVIRWGWREVNDPTLLLALIEAACVRARRLRGAGIYPDALVG